MLTENPCYRRTGSAPAHETIIVCVPVFIQQINLKGFCTSIFVDATVLNNTTTQLHISHVESLELFFY